VKHENSIAVHGACAAWANALFNLDHEDAGVHLARRSIRRRSRRRQGHRVNCAASATGVK